MAGEAGEARVIKNHNNQAGCGYDFVMTFRLGFLRIFAFPKELGVVAGDGIEPPTRFTQFGEEKVAISFEIGCFFLNL